MRFWPHRIVDDKKSNIGNVLVMMGVCNQAQIDEAAAKAQSLPGVLIGEVLIEMDAITTEVLAEALDLQSKMRKGHGADVMLRIVEKKTKDHHTRLFAELAH